MITITIQGKKYTAPSQPSEATLGFYERVNKFILSDDKSEANFLACLFGAPKELMGNAPNAEYLLLTVVAYNSWVFDWMQSLKDKPAPKTIGGYKVKGGLFAKRAKYELKQWGECTLSQRAILDSLNSESPDFVSRALAVYLAPQRYGTDYEKHLEAIRLELLEVPAVEALPAFFFLHRRQASMSKLGLRSLFGRLIMTKIAKSAKD